MILYGLVSGKKLSGTPGVRIPFPLWKDLRAWRLSLNRQIKTLKLHEGSSLLPGKAAVLFCSEKLRGDVALSL